ncbi:shikimate kinase [Rufibacter roseus]|uniref:Shikimate kinase n=1 Tax=Rufibacter roseus TaxID=1567108 RepID=A0ABW2DL48_9BACT|nr:shikimate kinase [Rufibacter roseus]
MGTIFLVGMPGCGKSSVGKVLAERLNYSFLDLDTLLEEQEGSSVAQIFKQKGQTYFREAEARALRSVAKTNGGVVLATGGGAPCFHDNMTYMIESGLAVYLKVSVAELAARLTELDLQVRPLLRNKSSEELHSYLAETLAQRERFYQMATLVQEVDRQSVEAVAVELYRQIRAVC